MPNKVICPKCSKEFIESATSPSAAVYIYKGQGDDKTRAISDGGLCTECLSKICEGWKYPLDFKPMPKKGKN